MFNFFALGTARTILYTILVSLVISVAFFLTVIITYSLVPSENSRYKVIQIKNVNLVKSFQAYDQAIFCVTSILLKSSLGNDIIKNLSPF